ncbi:hypothetical protein [Natrarchaeobaculum sulfurireducens]|uniref:hypothetical protein n=1 Tax=Natrarchaeobaculum sulfurireducens TaxID=2044521 RepID=UPI00105AB0CF|nr:hypothetical protein [Natrarchaeobaculum sulfurireducens]
MSVPNWVLKNSRFILGIVIAGTALSLLASVIYRHFGTTGIRSFEIAVSGVLTAVLAILYFRQTTILEQQKELRVRELDRELRQQHTETLRERIKEWHGDPSHSLGSTEETELNLPSVSGTSFNSAQTKDVYVVDGGRQLEESSFSVIPESLDGDKYFKDLLENHATDLKRQKERIEELHQEFVDHRNSFVNATYGETIEEDQCILKPTEEFSSWIFELFLREKRSLLRPDLETKSQQVLVQASYVNDSHQIHRYTRSGYGQHSIYTAHLKDDVELNKEEIDELEEEVECKTDELIQETLERIKKREEYSHIQEAARILDEGERRIEELEQTLVEYHGKPLYKGSCEYLDEGQ